MSQLVVVVGGLLKKHGGGRGVRDWTYFFHHDGRLEDGMDFVKDDRG